MRYLILFFLMFSLFSCGDQNSGAVTITSGDFSGYEVVNISNGPLQKATKTTANGSLDEDGFIYEGAKFGTWTSYYPDGKVKSTTQFANGRKNGLHLEFNDRCQITLQTNYLDDQIHGRHTKFRHGSRKEEEGEYKNGVLHGVSRTYDKLGKVQREISYQDGKLHGPNVFYNEDGQKTMEYQYENGEKVSGGIVDPSADPK